MRFSAVVLLFITFLALKAAPAVEPDTLILTNVNIIDTRSGNLAHNMTVVIKNGRIDGPYDSWVDANRNDRQDFGEPVVGDWKLLKDMGVNTVRLYHHAYWVAHGIETCDLRLTNIYGPFTGTLQDNGELIELLRPDSPEQDPDGTVVVPYVGVDSVHYGVRAPWPQNCCTSASGAR